jgi:uncharacterized protein (TIGR02145 family)
MKSIRVKSKATSQTGGGVVFDGHTYPSIVVDNGQEWMTENLRTSVYANGDPIINTWGGMSWHNFTSGAWEHYNRDSQFEDPYGKLYNRYAIVDPRNLCPTGWHVPTLEDWTLLIERLGGDTLAGGKLKSTGTQYWQSPNAGASNEIGFNGLPGGYRQYYYGDCYGIENYTSWWGVPDLIINVGTDNDNAGIGSGGLSGYSVRCIKD